MTDELILPLYSTAEPERVAAEGTTPEYRQTGSTNPPPEETHLTQPAAHDLPVGPEPEMAWLASDEAKRYQGHWVALAPDTGSFLGLADTQSDVLTWQRQGASIVFVVPSGAWIGG